MSAPLTHTFHASLDEVRARLPAALATGGFGILTEIDVAATLEKKLGVTMPGYRIVGACNPSFAHAAIQVDPRVGLAMPCNVVLRAVNDTTVVEFVDPVTTVGALGTPALVPLAAEARAHLANVLRALVEG